METWVISNPGTLVYRRSKNMCQGFDLLCKPRSGRWKEGHPTIVEILFDFDLEILHQRVISNSFWVLVPPSSTAR